MAERAWPVTWLTALFGLAIAVVFFIRVDVRAPTSPAEGTPALRARTVLALFLGVATGFVVFGYHAWYYFVVVHQLPLIVAPVCLAVAFTVSLLLDAAALSSPKRVLAWVALAALVGERLYLQWANVSAMGLPPRTGRNGGRFTSGPGGMYGENGQLVLAVAAVGLAVVLSVAAYAFLRVSPSSSAPRPAAASPRRAVRRPPRRPPGSFDGHAIAASGIGTGHPARRHGLGLLLPVTGRALTVADHQRLPERLLACLRLGSRRHGGSELPTEVGRECGTCSGSSFAGTRTTCRPLRPRAGAPSTAARAILHAGRIGTAPAL